MDARTKRGAMRCCWRGSRRICRYESRTTKNRDRGASGGGCSAVLIDFSASRATTRRRRASKKCDIYGVIHTTRKTDAQPSDGQVYERTHAIQQGQGVERVYEQARAAQQPKGVEEPRQVPTDYPTRKCRAKQEASHRRHRRREILLFPICEASSRMGRRKPRERQPMLPIEPRAARQSAHGEYQHRPPIYGRAILLGNR